MSADARGSAEGAARASGSEEAGEKEKGAFGRLTVRMAVQLAAPHTWPAAILPALVATAAAIAHAPSASLATACVLLAVCVLMQSAVNTFNDYYDYVKGPPTPCSCTTTWIRARRLASPSGSWRRRSRSEGT